MQKGLVVKSTGSWYYTKDQNNNIIQCKIKGIYRIKGIKATNPVAVGDKVKFSLTDDGQTGIIQDIEERKNYIIRRSPKLSKQYQLIASNIDQAILMVSLKQPKTLPEFIDRFLVSSEAFRIPVILVFNKTDLYDERLTSYMNRMIEMYNRIGYYAFPMSIYNNLNLDKIEEVLKDSVSVISGNSGVGKTSLLNYLNPELNLKTTLVSSHHKAGQHTTTFAEMFFLDNGIRIIDTPGIKGFGMVDIVKDELFHFFPEIFRISKHCRFNNCLHVNEPGCAVIEAVENNQISNSRFLSYISMLEDLGDKYRK